MTTPALTAQATLAHYGYMKEDSAELVELRQLREEVARLRPDAERYRWLRSDDIEMLQGHQIYVVKESLPLTANEVLVESALDAAIDAAIDAALAADKGA